MAVFQDSFTESTDTELNSHTPDTGTSWTALIQTPDSGSVIVATATEDAAIADGGANEAALYTADAVYPSANYEVQVTAVSPDTLDDKCILAARVQDANNMYAVQFNGTNGGTNETDNQMYKRVSGTWTKLGSTFAAVANGSVVKFVVEGSSIRFYDDGVEVASATDSDISAAGKAGLGAGAVIVSTCDLSNQWVDDLVVNDIGSTTTSTTTTTSTSSTTTTTTTTSTSTSTTYTGTTTSTTTTTTQSTSTSTSSTTSVSTTTTLPAPFLSNVRVEQSEPQFRIRRIGG